MNLSDFDYHLPPELIAQQPAPQRDASRLLVLDRAAGALEHLSFSDIGRCIRPGDVLVANDTRVIPARVYAHKPTGGRVELLLLQFMQAPEPGLQQWQCLARSHRGLRPGQELACEGGMIAVVRGRAQEKTWLVDLYYEGAFDEALERCGRPPLPPYIARDPEQPAREPDRERYQTVYARAAGAVAAPTAGLHFTPELMVAIERQGAAFAFVTLHVGYGTFEPLRDDSVDQHRMHSESYCLSPEAAGRITRARRQGGRIIAVGTTSARVLETCADESGILHPAEGATDLFVYPGYRFKAVDALITNFHLPRSSLLLLVSAFAGRQAVLAAYGEAVRQRYRFFSYGDAMLIL
ncbi:MAG: tRNA preQ1(34) S-adenosylmethionine ribosyltransferase-isomerase QueA [Deltaproteobacteria bacterium]|nr:tRNA preQ1(34) S-adenosylmethionine ribosyltransferase-isomerase QueA [Deltaproteobacteria bacterium]